MVSPALDRALQQLETLDPDQARIVELRVFGRPAKARNPTPV